jgi:hypothetical protein
MIASLVRPAALIPIFFLFLSCSTLQSLPKDTEPDTDEIRKACSSLPDFPEFGSEFSAILSRLLTDAWKEDGDWSGDFQGDATFFAPVILYALWQDTGNQVFLKMANRTVDHEKSLLKRFSLFPVPGMDMVIGFPVLAESYKATGDPDSLDRYLSGVKKGSAMASFYPGFFTPFIYDKASVYGTIGTMTLQAYELTMDESFRKSGLDLIAEADHSCWNEQEGLYAYEQLADWPQATMLIALGRAFKVTGDRHYLDRCNRIISSMDERFLDLQRGGYYGHPTGMTKGLSGNNTIAWASLDLFEATGDRRYLERTASLLKWILSEDLYDSQSGIIYHHWDKNSGRSGNICNGCNFHTLCIIHRYNRLIHSIQPGLRQPGENKMP